MQMPHLLRAAAVGRGEELITRPVAARLLGVEACEATATAIAAADAGDAIHSTARRVVGVVLGEPADAKKGLLHILLRLNSTREPSLGLHGEAAVTNTNTKATECRCGYLVMCGYLFPLRARVVVGARGCGPRPCARRTLMVY